MRIRGRHPAPASTPCSRKKAFTPRQGLPPLLHLQVVAIAPDGSRQFDDQPERPGPERAMDGSIRKLLRGSDPPSRFPAPPGQALENPAPARGHPGISHPGTQSMHAPGGTRHRVVLACAQKRYGHLMSGMGVHGHHPVRFSIQSNNGAACFSKCQSFSNNVRARAPMAASRSRSAASRRTASQMESGETT